MKEDPGGREMMMPGVRRKKRIAVVRRYHIVYVLA
jgi:hypothetical protein